MGLYKLAPLELAIALVGDASFFLIIALGSRRFFNFFWDIFWTNWCQIVSGLGPAAAGGARTLTILANQRILSLLFWGFENLRESTRVNYNQLTVNKL